MNKKYVKIVSTGMYIPPKVLTNADLEKIVDTTDEWITTRTGIKERHIVEENISTSDIATLAAQDAIKNANISVEDIDAIIVATITQDMFFPSTACLVHQKLGIQKEVLAFDISAACSGFVYGLAVATSMIKTNICRNVLLIGAETMSKFTNWKDRSTCVLFGDGAGAMILSQTDNEEENAVLSTYLSADGKYTDLLYIPAGGSKMPASHKTVEENLHTIFMSGKEVFKLAVTKMVESAISACNLAGIKTQDLDLLIPHQANLRIINAVGERVDISPEKVFVNVHKYGNMSAATTIVGLHEAILEGKVKKGSKVCLISFGAGFTWASCVIKL
ncbi:MAG: beta-ketoacyl-ACP synthase III [Endomicrobiia bacterium]